MLFLVENFNDWLTPILNFFLSTHLSVFTQIGAGDIYFQLVLKNITFCFVQYVIDRFSLYVSYVSEIQVENNGFEPLTPCVQGRCSSQLS